MRKIGNSHLDRESYLAPQFYFQVDNNIQADRADLGLNFKSRPRPIINESLTLRRPLRRKFWMRWFLDVSKVKESSFF